MNLNTLKAFRQQVYDCMEQRADALFSLCDSLLSEPQARSLPELSHSPFFGRQWPSVYAALADGRINVDQLQALCVRSLLEEVPADTLVWLAVDATPEERPQAHTSEDRGYIHVSNLPLADKPISIGWMFSVVANRRAVGFPHWLSNASGVSRRRWEWQLTSFGNSSRSLARGESS